jgi:hypothetical protein
MEASINPLDCAECAIAPGIGHRYNCSLAPRPAVALECCECWTLHKTTIETSACGGRYCKKPFCNNCILVGRWGPLSSSGEQEYSGIEEARDRPRQRQNLMTEEELEELFLDADDAANEDFWAYDGWDACLEEIDF